MGWKDAPLAGEATPAGTPKWQSAPVASAPLPQLPAELADLPVPGYAGDPALASTTTAPVADTFSETAFAQGTSGLNEGIASALGAPVDLTNLALRAGAAGINKVTGSDIQLPENAFGGSASLRQVMAPAIRPESEQAGNQMVRRIGQEFGANLIPGMGVAARAARPIQSAATQAAVTLGSGAAAAATEQFTDNPYAEMVASILGGGAVAGGLAATKRAVTPIGVPAERAAANATLDREGVELTAGQRTGNKPLQYAESEIGGRGAEEITGRQAEQFTQAALARVGVSAPRATPEVMEQAYSAIGQQFDDLAVRNTLAADAQMGQDLGAVVRQYNSVTNESARAPIIQNTLVDVVNAIRQNGGQISGEAYKTLRSNLSRSARGTANPELREALQGIQGALDDAMERSIAVNNPADAGAWQQVRSDYRNFLVLENAASRAGEQAALGIITPASLRSAVAQQGKRAYTQGRGDFADLARSGAAAMSALPNSGTASRLRAAGATVPPVLGAAVGGQTGDVLGALAGAAAGAAVPGAIGKLMMSGPGQRYLSNSAWTRPLDLPQNSAVPAGGALLELIRSTALN